MGLFSFPPQQDQRSRVSDELLLKFPEVHYFLNSPCPARLKLGFIENKNEAKGRRKMGLLSFPPQQDQRSRDRDELLLKFPEVHYFPLDTQEYN